MTHTNSAGKLAQNERREQLRYNYTPDERREKGQQLADALNRMAIEEANLDRIKADFKARLATIGEEVTATKNAVLSGYELREYVCFWEYDTPSKGRKTLRRKEPPCDIVREEEMTIADRQTVMESIEEQVQQGPATPAPDSTEIVLSQAPLPPGMRMWVPKPGGGSVEVVDADAERIAQAAEAAERRKASRKRRTNATGVVATDADGAELADPDETKGAQ